MLRGSRNEALLKKNSRRSLALRKGGAWTRRKRAGGLEGANRSLRLEGDSPRRCRQKTFGFLAEEFRFAKLHAFMLRGSRTGALLFLWRICNKMKHQAGEAVKLK